MDNAIIVETDHLGALTLIGPGAGMYPTGSAMVSDFLHIIGKRETGTYQLIKKSDSISGIACDSFLTI